MFAQLIESMPSNYHMTTGSAWRLPFTPASLTCAAPQVPPPPAPLLPRHYDLQHSTFSANTLRHPHRLSPAEIPTETEVFLKLLIKVFAQEVETSRIDPCQDEGARNGNHARVRLRFSITFTYVLIMDSGAHIHTCRFCGGAEFMRSVWQPHDAFPGDGDTRTRVFALNRLVTKCPALLGISMQMRGISEPANDTPTHASSQFAYSTPMGLRR